MKTIFIESDLSSFEDFYDSDWVVGLEKLVKSTDIESIVEIMLKVSQLVTDFPEIIEMDSNPLFVKKNGEGSIAGDARIRIGG